MRRNWRAVSPRRCATVSADWTNLRHRKQSDRLRATIADALARGAHFISGELRKDGTLATPVVLAGVPHDAAILRHDFFAPILSIVTVAYDFEAIERANDCPFALGASVFSRDLLIARKLASSLTAGLVTINDVIVPSANPAVPFGGAKRSGFGTTRGPEGLLEMTRPKVVTNTQARFRPAFDPPQPRDPALFENFIALKHGRRFTQRFAALCSLIRNALQRRTTN